LPAKYYDFSGDLPVKNRHRTQVECTFEHDWDSITAPVFGPRFTPWRMAGKNPDAPG